MDDCHM